MLGGSDAANTKHMPLSARSRWKLFFWGGNQPGPNYIRAAHALVIGRKTAEARRIQFTWPQHNTIRGELQRN